MLGSLVVALFSCGVCGLVLGNKKPATAHVDTSDVPAHSATAAPAASSAAEFQVPPGYKDPPLVERIAKIYKTPGAEKSFKTTKNDNSKTTTYAYRISPKAFFDVERSDESPDAALFEVPRVEMELGAMVPPGGLKKVCVSEKKNEIFLMRGGALDGFYGYNIDEKSARVMSGDFADRFYLHAPCVSRLRCDARVPEAKRGTPFEAARKCKEAVKSNLKSPTSAEFHGDTLPVFTLECSYLWLSHVDSANSFNAKIRANFVCKYDPSTDTAAASLVE